MPNATPRRPRSGQAPGLTGQHPVVKEADEVHESFDKSRPSAAELTTDVFDNSISDGTSGMDTLAPVENAKPRGSDFPIADDSEASIGADEKGPTTQVIDNRRTPSVVIDDSLYDDETERRDTQIKKIGGRPQNDS